MGLFGVDTMWRNMSPSMSPLTHSEARWVKLEIVKNRRPACNSLFVVLAKSIGRKNIPLVRKADFLALYLHLFLERRLV